MGLFLLRSGYLLKEIIYVIDSIHLVCQDYFEYINAIILTNEVATTKWITSITFPAMTNSSVIDNDTFSI